MTKEFVGIEMVGELPWTSVENTFENFPDCRVVLAEKLNIEAR